VEQDGHYRQLWDVQPGGRAASRESRWSRPRRDATTASNALVTAVRLLVAAGPTDLAALAVNESEGDQIREAASILAALTPEQIDALRDLGATDLAALVGQASRPASLAEAAQ
jgi:hypothetical protein